MQTSHPCIASRSLRQYEITATHIIATRALQRANSHDSLDRILHFWPALVTSCAARLVRGSFNLILASASSTHHGLSIINSTSISSLPDSGTASVFRSNHSDSFLFREFCSNRHLGTVVFRPNHVWGQSSQYKSGNISLVSY